MTTKFRLIGIGIMLLLLIGLLLVVQLTQATASIPYKDSAAVATGKAIYERECASCHGIDLKGEPDWQQRNTEGYLPAPPHDQSGHTWHHEDQLLFQITKEGIQSVAGADYRSNMPAFAGKLTDQEIWSVLAYIKASWPEEIQQRHTTMFSKK